MRMIIMCGLPGSGKSTYANGLEKEYSIINQDIIGNRNKCVQLTKLLLSENKSVIIDRTNITKFQRNIWIKLAKEYKVTDIHCVEFKISPEVTIERVKSRKNHPTIKEDTPLEKINSIIRRFLSEYQTPELSEGFTSIFSINISSDGKKHFCFRN